jgi:benzoyl-CoA reductase subunit B
MAEAEQTSEMVGRGAEEGAALFRSWFEDLTGRAERGERAAYVFVMGSLAEILRVFDLPMVFPEINALQTAVRRVSHEYLNEAEDYGYSPDICGYVKADVAMQLGQGKHPMGRIPKPALAVLTNACNTYIKWAEIWERLHRVPIFTLDVPGTRREGYRSLPGDPDFERDRAYVAHQLQELISLCEKVTGRKFDIDRLREVLGHTNQMCRDWREVLRWNRSKPSVFNALTDGTVYLGVLNAFRGTPEGARYFERLVEEMRYKSVQGIGTLREENFRLIFVGVPCYPIFRRFNELFSEWGGGFVGSTYLWFAAGGANVDFAYDLDRPLESLAEGVLLSVREAMDSMFFPVGPLKEMVRSLEADGVVFHPIKSCRTTSAGMADIRRALQGVTDVPSLLVESDMMDKRVVAEAQMKNRIDAFFENMRSRKLAAAGAMR